MDKSKITKFITDVRSAVSKHSPEILTGIGIAGMITTTILAVKATPKALRLIEEAEYEKYEETYEDSDSTGKEPLTVIETVKAAWRPYIPAAVTGVVSVGCLVGGCSIHARRNAALATAYQLSTTALKEYKAKVVETIGERKEKTIREKIATDKIEQQPVVQSEVIIAGEGDVLFLEPVSMRHFTSNIEHIRRVINDINYRMTTGMEEYISLSEFYDEIGLSHTSTSDYIGWNLYKDGQLKIDLPASKTQDGRPCLMLDYMVEPRYDYSKLM